MDQSMRYNIVEASDNPVQEWLPAEDLGRIFKGRTEPIVGLEIGTDTGISTRYLLDMIPGLKLYGIDPYINYIDWNNMNLNEREETYKIFMHSLSRYGNRHVHYRMTSDDAVSKFEDESLDFIFVDGLHTYDQVLLDCRNYYPKLKKNGLFCGHDYGTIEEVRRAVDEFAKEVNKEIQFMRQDNWTWIKD
jgi:predicted O-methyltransferase YrrM